MGEVLVRPRRLNSLKLFHADIISVLGNPEKAGKLLMDKEKKDTFILIEYKKRGISVRLYDHEASVRLKGKGIRWYSKSQTTGLLKCLCPEIERPFTKLFGGNVKVKRL